MAATSPSPISFSNVQSAFGGVAPISLSEYYAASIPASTAQLLGVPASGRLPLSSFTVRRPTSWTFAYTYDIYQGTSAPTQASMSDGVYDQAGSVWASNVSLYPMPWLPSVTADFGNVRTVSNAYVASIVESFPGGWGPLYVNNCNLETSTDGVSFVTANVVSGVVDGTASRFVINRACRFLRIVRPPSTPGYMGIGDFYFD